MPRSRWNSRIKVGLILIFLLTLGGSGYYSWAHFSAYKKHHAYERQSAAEYDAANAKQGPESCRPVMSESSVFEWFACLAETVATSGDTKNSDYDLKAQQDMAEWALGVLMVSGFTLLVTAVGVIFVWLTFRAAHVTTKAVQTSLEIELAPFLTVEMEPISPDTKANGFYLRNERVKEVWFKVKNSGKSAVIIECIGRTWSLCPDRTFPKPMDHAAQHNDVSVKNCSIPVAGNSESSEIRALLYTFSPQKDRNKWTDGKIFFHGFLRYRDLVGSRYVSGFCIIYSNGRFHIAWPIETPEAYNYHKKLEDTA